MNMRAGMMSLWFIVLSPCMTRAQNTMERIEKRTNSPPRAALKNDKQLKCVGNYKGTFPQLKKEL